ncbi:MAG: AAA family ATPase [Saprospiraceae bacterium]
MQKLVIKGQFMAVQPCEIELRRFLLLIGEQASGKSTIAKLIYFFQTLPDAIYESIVSANGKDVVNLKTSIGKKFSELFGGATSGYSGQVKPDGRIYEIIFQYSDSHSLRIFATFAWIKYEIEEELENGLDLAIEKYKSSIKLRQEKVDEINARQTLRNELDILFNRENNEHSYLIAGRSTTTAFPEIFERVVESELEKLLEEAVKEQDFEARLRLGSERLLYEFVQWSRDVRIFFSRNGETFSKVARSLGNHQVALSKLSTIATTVLKGEYESSQSPSIGEQIKVKSLRGGYVWIKMKDASSGQQEVLRILQGILLAIGLKNRREFFVIEEPEAHLYPLAQKEVVNAFAVFLNAIPQGRVVMTTHSPYILACVNILLLAHFVSQERGGNGIEREISEAAVPREFWLNSADFTAYAIGHPGEYCRNIKDDVTGLVAENYLDSISEVLGMQYRQLYDLLTLADA